MSNNTATYAQHPADKTKNLTTRYLIALSLIALLSISAYVMIYLHIYKMSSDAHVINLSGRQRMLSQKLTKELLLAVQQQSPALKEQYFRQLKETEAIWTRVHIGLQKGDDELDLPGKNSEQIVKLFAIINPYHERIKQAVDNILQSDSLYLALLSLDSPLVQEVVEVSSALFMGSMDTIVFQYDKEAQIRVDRLKRLEASILAFLLAVLVSIGVFIFRPVVKAVQKSHDELAAANESLRKSEQNFRNIFQSVPESLLAVNDEFEVLNSNKAFEELIRRYVSLLNLSEDELRETILSELRQHFGKTTHGIIEIGKGMEGLVLEFDFAGKLFAEEEAIVVSLKDITERKLAEEASKQAEELKNSIYKISEAVHSAQDLEELFRLIHHVVRELMSAKNFYIALYDPDSEIISFPYFIDEYDETPAPKKLGKGLTEYVFRTGKPLLASSEVFEELVKKSEVEQIGTPSIDWLGVPLKTGDKTIGILVTQSYTKGVRFGEKEKDILMFVSDQVAMAVERKRAEEEVKKLSEVVEQSPDMVFITDPNGKIEYVNPAFTEVTGYSAEDAFGGTPTILNSGEMSKEYFQQLWSTILSGKTFRLEVINRKKNGEFFIYDQSITPLKDAGGNIINFISTGKDITERRAAQKEIERLANFPRQNPLPVIEMNFNCLVTYINPATEAILKRLGLSKSQVNNILPGNCKQMVQDGLEKGKKVSSQEVQLRDRVLLWSGHPLKDLNLFHFYATDVTERVETRKELEKALVRAEQSDRVKTLFLANMSHEIRTPLNAILGFTDLLEASTGHLVGEEEKGFFGMIRNSGDRLMRTVHEILDISQIEAGTYDLKMEHLDLVKLFEELVHECQLMADEKGLKLEYTSDIDTAFIKADRYGVSQAINNIIDNAIKYTEQGKITISLEQKDKQYVLSIQDTGIGISEEYLDSLFEAFSQESEGYTKKYQGIGLGLAITKRHLDLNNVGIKVDSTKDVGTTVTLTFKPVKKRLPEKRVKEEAKVIPTAEPTEKPLVLLVEDDLTSQKLAEFFLRKKYDTCFAVSVDEAKEQLKKCSVNLILLDLSLVGDEDGLDLVRWMRKTRTWQKTPVIATTAHAFTKDRDNCLAAGCNDYLAKPIKREKLLEKISNFV